MPVIPPFGLGQFIRLISWKLISRKTIKHTLARSFDINMYVFDKIIADQFDNILSANVCSAFDFFLVMETKTCIAYIPISLQKIKPNSNGKFPPD
jgi:hypothetical protein